MTMLRGGLRHLGGIDAITDAATVFAVEDGIFRVLSESCTFVFFFFWKTYSSFTWGRGLNQYEPEFSTRTKTFSCFSISLPTPRFV